MAKLRTPAEINADEKRTGRPPKRPQDRQSYRVTVQLTQVEMIKIKAAAKAANTSIAAMIMSPWREQPKEK
jgi:hypothetical protein